LTQRQADQAIKAIEAGKDAQAENALLQQKVEAQQERLDAKDSINAVLGRRLSVTHQKFAITDAAYGQERERTDALQRSLSVSRKTNIGLGGALLIVLLTLTLQ
jgi:hypothetical protein